jgi:hypothetical protein
MDAAAKFDFLPGRCNRLCSAESWKLKGLIFVYDSWRREQTFERFNRPLE